MESWLEAFARANFRRSADTAHDLKTPLNVAVLNLELLRIRVAKFDESIQDEKIAAYARAIETELRRMAQIFDAFFLLSTPPSGEGDPVPFDPLPLCRDLAEAAGFRLEVSGAVRVRVHRSRMQQAAKLFFDGASRILRAEGRGIAVEAGGGQFTMIIHGRPAAADFEASKIFKFYYTAPDGSPDLSLATARLIAETYGGELKASEEEHDKVALRFTLPQVIDETSADR